MRLQSCGICIKTVRLLCYKLFALVKICCNLFGQMSLLTSLQNSYNSLSRSRKILLFGILIAVTLLYMWPSWLSLGGKRIQLHVEPQDLCLDAYIQGVKTSLEEYDILLETDLDLPEDVEHFQFNPFVGNGHLGLTVLPEEALRIRNGRALSLKIPFYPIVTATLLGYESKDITALNIQGGHIEKVQCFATGHTCVSISTRSIAHRSRSDVLLQALHIKNPTDKSITITLQQIGISDWKHVVTQRKTGQNSRQEDVAYSVSIGTVEVPDQPEFSYVVSVASTKVLDDITISSGGFKLYQVLTAVKYSDQPMKTTTVTEEIKQQIADLAEKALVQALNVNPNLLQSEHLKVWEKQWRSGFGISLSKAPDAVNGNQINATLYYTMSNCKAPLHEMDKPDEEKTALQKLLYFPDRCYDGHQTLQNSRLWDRSKISQTDELIELVRMWIITLEKHGCLSMLNAGADGVLQAMMLSFGGMRFSNEHLEFNTEPKDLHRDYFFRRINYGDSTHVNVTVLVGSDNKAMLYAALDRNDRDFYACDAGCLDEPVKLSRELQQFPVKLTNPLTAIMYITADRTHMAELKHAIHVQENVIAPAHEHHVIALHKHGHHLGGLPLIFWLAIGVLIAIFHLFLFKLIFNEYCQPSVDRYQRSMKFNAKRQTVNKC